MIFRPLISGGGVRLPRRCGLYMNTQKPLKENTQTRPFCFNMEVVSRLKGVRRGVARVVSLHKRSSSLN